MLSVLFFLGWELYLCGYREGLRVLYNDPEEFRKGFTAQSLREQDRQHVTDDGLDDPLSLIGPESPRPATSAEHPLRLSPPGPPQD